MDKKYELWGKEVKTHVAQSIKDFLEHYENQMDIFVDDFGKVSAKSLFTFMKRDIDILLEDKEIEDIPMIYY